MRGFNIKKLLRNRKVDFCCFPQQAVPLLTKAAQMALADRKVTDYYFTVTLVSDKRIKELNRRFRKVNRITDVISFRLDSRPLWGDIYISRGRSQKQAKEIGHAWKRELVYLVLHGVLHVIGYTDYTNTERRKMFKKQDSLFKWLYS